MDDFVNLSNFFAVFVALNISYTGFKWFRIIINNDLLKLESELSALEAKLDQFIILFSLPESKTKELKQEKDRILFSLNTRYETTKTKRESNSNFEHDYHKIFLSSALFCIVMVLLIGLGSKNNGERNDFLLTLISYSFSIVFLQFYIFLTGWFNNSASEEQTFTGHWLWKLLSRFINPIKKETALNKHWLWKLFYWFTRLFKGELTLPKLNKTLFIILFFSVYMLAIFIAFLNHSLFPIFPKFESSTCIWCAIAMAILPSFLFLIRAFFYKRRNKSVCKFFSKSLKEHEEGFLNLSEKDIDIVVSEIQTAFNPLNKDESDINNNFNVRQYLSKITNLFKKLVKKKKPE